MRACFFFAHVLLLHVLQAVASPTPTVLGHVDRKQIQADFNRLVQIPPVANSPTEVVRQLHCALRDMQVIQELLSLSNLIQLENLQLGTSSATNFYALIDWLSHQYTTLDLALHQDDDPALQEDLLEVRLLFFQSIEPWFHHVNDELAFISGADPNDLVPFWKLPLYKRQHVSREQAWFLFFRWLSIRNLFDHLELVLQGKSELEQRSRAYAQHSLHWLLTNPETNQLDKNMPMEELGYCFDQPMVFSYFITVTFDQKEEHKPLLVFDTQWFLHQVRHTGSWQKKMDLLSLFAHVTEIDLTHYLFLLDSVLYIALEDGLRPSETHLVMLWSKIMDCVLEVSDTNLLSNPILGVLKQLVIMVENVDSSGSDILKTHLNLEEDVTKLRRRVQQFPDEFRVEYKHVILLLLEAIHQNPHLS